MTKRETHLGKAEFRINETILHSEPLGWFCENQKRDYSAKYMTASPVPLSRSESRGFLLNSERIADWFMSAAAKSRYYLSGFIKYNIWVKGLPFTSHFSGS